MSRIFSLRVLASVAALSVFGAVGAWGTYSAFTDTTDASGSTFSAGTVHITDDDAGTALFTLTGLVPGASAVKCINVTNSGDVPFSGVALSAASSGALAGALQVTIDKGTGAAGGASSSCASFAQTTAGLVSGLLNALPTAASPQDDNSAWAVGATRSYRVTVKLDPLAPGTFQGKTASLDLTWTAGQLIRVVRRAATAALAVAILAGPAAALAAHRAGWQPLVERSASMAPTIATGDLVLVRRGRADRMRRGDVVTFADPRVAGRTLTHRVVAVRAAGRHLRVVTRGDANRAAETWTIHRAGTVGQLRATVPLPDVVTALLDRSRQRGVVMAVLSLLACGLTLWAIWRRPVAVPCAPAR